MKRRLLLLAGVIISSFLGCSPQKGQVEETNPRPNVILILADDMGYSDLGCYGGEIKTPSIDQLADNGMRLTQFYNASRCCPTRASLLTGLYPHQANMGFMQEDCHLPNYGGYIPNNAVTIAEALKLNGYNTAMSGKWHVGNKEEYWPTKKGFDKFYGFPHHGGAYFYPFPGDQVVAINDSLLAHPGEDYYSTEAINEYGAQFVKEMSQKDAPFFLYLAHVAPHFPLQARAEDIAKYRGSYKRNFEEVRQERFKKQKELGIIPQDYPISKTDRLVEDWDKLSEEEKDDYDLRMSIYAAQIENMDRGIGELVNTLKEIGELDNTMIIFISDNGGTREDYSWGDPNIPLGHQGSFGCYKLPWANVSNTPYRMFKHWGHEGGIRTPFVVHYPKMIQPKSIDNQPAHIVDVMTTIMEVTQSDYPTKVGENDIQPMEGKSLLPILAGNVRTGHQGIFWEHEGNKAARLGDWKWVNIYPEGTDELYHLSEDPIEAHNIASQHPEKLKELQEAWQNWADRVGVVPWEQVLEHEPSQGRLQIWYEQPVPKS
ncbi:sulfatase-like hydrolase/transferase [Flammeovirga yaeyamensis]|uniref:Sulfatase-like hydrolase/transferase n=1 Tax=Flammeovirga yaeyamensis TaxID=367791 RepID=A0AAX1NCA2_9BACT|nr:arylsulfatase [Flammeovirga yaeyamensis]MBB3697235.1 arylsulfatase [Flammeovirga yaeyamensis]NMF33893.1 arylsulfatase [Flammeovirga yaeyamensis]QWG04847.1 sulfatase-like hydrolase/transferase [Flammeovirga yaeyamensis]